MTSVISEEQTALEKLTIQVQLLIAQNEDLARENARLAKDLSDFMRDANETISNLNSQLDEAHVEIDRLIEQIKFANQHRFGSSSEVVVPDQLSLFNDIEAATDDKAKEPEVDDILPKKPHRRGGKAKIDYSKFETVIINHEIAEGDRACPECGCALEEMNIEITRRVRIVPAHLVVEEHHRHVYRCKECCDDNAAGGENKAIILRAPQPNPPIPGSFATPSLISYIINGKYGLSLPLYRMENELKGLGAPISRQNMANWVMDVHVKWLSKVYARMKAELLSHDLLHADETRVQVLKEPNREPQKQSKMWLFCAAACNTPVYIFEYHETRRKSVVQDFLRSWKGTLTTDGYSAYYNLGIDGIENTSCLVHIRRGFAKIVRGAGGDEKAASKSSIALEARQRIDEMFRIDAKFDDLSPAERKEARDKELRPLMEEFGRWAKKQLPKASPKLALYKALQYAITYWPYVMNVLGDGRLELTNNLAERSIRPFVVGRKNWLFSNTPKGAEASACTYSIVTTAKANGLVPRLYIEWLLTELPNAGELTDEVVDDFMPWSEKVPDSCRMTPEQFAKAKEEKDDPILDIDPDFFDDEFNEEIDED